MKDSSPRRPPIARRFRDNRRVLTGLDKFLLFVALPAVVLTSLIEAIVIARLRSYDWRASAVSLFDLFARVGVQIFLPLSIATPIIALAYQHRVGDIALDGAAALLALFIGQEFCYYWYHRAAHRVRWFWCNHAVHHSSNELNLSAAYRIGFLGRASGSALFYVPLICHRLRAAHRLRDALAQPALPVLDPRDLDPASWAGSSTC